MNNEDKGIIQILSKGNNSLHHAMLRFLSYLASVSQKKILLYRNVNGDVTVIIKLRFHVQQNF